MSSIDAQVTYCTDDDGRKGVQLEFDASELTEEGIKRAVVQLLNSVQSQMTKASDNVIFRADTTSLRVFVPPDTKICETICFFQEIHIKYVDRPGPPNVEVFSSDPNTNVSELDYIAERARNAAGF